MKKIFAMLISSILLVAAFAACGDGGQTSVPPTSPGPQVETTSQSAEPTQPQGPGALTMYENIEDVPGHDYTLTTLENHDRAGEIKRDGKPWCSPPADSQFQNPVFASSEYLFVRAVWPSGEYQWYYFNWDISNADIVVPDSGNKMFTGVVGDALICEDGKLFDTLLWEWYDMQ